MAASDEPPALAYIEKTLADSYRKEIDQEENVWRSLPFFAATLALQLAALFQIIDKLPDPADYRLAVHRFDCLGRRADLHLFVLSGGLNLPPKVRLPREGTGTFELREGPYSHRGGPGAEQQEDPFSALVTLKTEIARQYAQATDNNRQINKRRERRRSIAGLAALGSVLTMVFLVGAAYAHYLSTGVEKDHGHAARRSVATPAEGGSGNNSASHPVPAPPPMQIVTKGWWTLRDEQASVDELEAVDHEQE